MLDKKTKQNEINKKKSIEKIQIWKILIINILMYVNIFFEIPIFLIDIVLLIQKNVISMNEQI